MRQDAKKVKPSDISSIQGYHAGGNFHNEAYAFDGFVRNWYFNSDRKIELDDHFNRADGQPLQGFGLEIETECRGINNRSVLAEIMTKVILTRFKFGTDMWKLQSDGSLGGDSSVEVISQVMTKSRIRNDYATYKTMFNEYFPALGISADSFRTACGMHVNVSNACFGKTRETQEQAIRKLYYIINKHYDFFVRAFYRCPSKTHWCGRMDYSVAKTMDLNHASASHGNCMNLSHYRAGRIEIRLVGGQKDYFCFRNTMETVFHVVERCRTISWEKCDSLAEIFKGCNQYVYKRISTECAGLIPSADMEIIRENVKPEDLELH